MNLLWKGHRLCYNNNEESVVFLFLLLYMKYRVVNNINLNVLAGSLCCCRSGTTRCRTGRWRPRLRSCWTGWWPRRRTTVWSLRCSRRRLRRRHWGHRQQRQRRRRRHQQYCRQCGGRSSWPAARPAGSRSWSSNGTGPGRTARRSRSRHPSLGGLRHRGRPLSAFPHTCKEWREEERGKTKREKQSNYTAHGDRDGRKVGLHMKTNLVKMMHGSRNAYVASSLLQKRLAARRII